MFKKSAFFSILFLLGSAGLTPSLALFEKVFSPLAQPAGYQVSMTSKPSPPELGENLVELSVKDAAGKPVPDAQVTFTASMPGMKMSTDDEILKTENRKNGHYAAKVDLSMWGKWQVTAHIRRGQQAEAAAVFEFDIKWE